MNVMVIGLGSMGKRRIRLLLKYDKQIQIYGIDTDKNRRKECEETFNIKTYDSIISATTSNNVEHAFICTGPLSHNKLITECLEKHINVFSELNLVSDGYDKNIKLAKDNKLTLFLSSTFLYRDEIKEVKKIVKNNNSLLNYTYHVGQYLPDWHPWENYKDFFVADNRTNGCREIFAIELPWLIDVFGDIVKLKVVKDKISELDIDYNDNYLVIFEHSTGHKGTLAVDIVSRKPVRNLNVYGEQLYLEWNGSPKGLTIYDYENKKDIEINLYNEIDQLNNYSEFVVENAYYNEIESFFAAVNKIKTPLYNFEKDYETLKIIDEIEGLND